MSPIPLADALIEARDLTLSYGNTPALQGCSIAIGHGERVAMMGPSGSGKSSLLHCLAGVLVPTTGSVTVAGQRLEKLSDAQRSRLRLAHMGVVFQFGDLVPELTLRENVMLPAQLLGMRAGEARDRATELLERLQIGAVADRRAGAVAGGQAQRAAVARALVHGPDIVLADEPTGSLDTISAEVVLDALVDLTTRSGASLLVVTHDHQVASHLDRLVTLRDGIVMARSGVAS